MEARELTTQEELSCLSFLRKFTGLSEDEGRDLVTILIQPTPKEIVRTRPIRGGGNAKYVPGSEFIKRFNQAFGFLWSIEYPQVFKTDTEVVTQGRWSLQIPGRTITKEYPDGTKETIKFDGFSIVKEQFGSSEIKRWAKDVTNKAGQVTYKAGSTMDLGNDYKAAATDAMKKCGTELGMFLDVYGPKDTSEEAGPSEKQLNAFYYRAGNNSMNREEADKWATEQLGKPLKEATEKDILGLVADLIALEKENKS